ncbi:unnamed protein product [Gordionus sp. m RMFG-2023]
MSKKFYETNHINLYSPYKEVEIPVPWGHIAGKLWNNDLKSKKVLCVHGWLDNANSFDPLISLLPQNITFLAIDLSGHGKSSHLPNGSQYYFTNWIFELARVIKFMKWDHENEKISLIGHSMGAGVCLLYASLFADKIEKCVSLDVVAPYNYPVDKCYDILQQSLKMNFIYENDPDIGDKPYTYDNAIKRLLEFQSLNEKSAKIMLQRGMTQNIDDANTYKMNRDIRLHYKTPMYFSDDHWKLFLNKLKCPTYVILGKNSHIKGEIISEAKYIEYESLLKKILGSKFLMKEYPGTHHLHMNTPELIAQSITQFLTS